MAPKPGVWALPVDLDLLAVALTGGIVVAAILYEAVSAFISQKAPGFNWWGIAISQMKAFCSLFVNAIVYEVPDQDLDLETEELPPMPKSRFIMRNVRRRQ